MTFRVFDFERSQLRVFLFLRPAQPAISKTDNTDDNENDPDNSSWLHGSERPSASNQLNDQHDQRDDQQEVDEPAKGVGTNQAKQPQNEQYNKYSPKHSCLRFNLTSQPDFALRVEFVLFADLIDRFPQVPIGPFQLRPGGTLVALGNLRQHAHRSIAQFLAGGM
jgi:hypothetical protein